MGRKGSITVFLSLALVLLFSFILTTLEAARLVSGTAYVSMLSAVAGDSVLANYYSPLLEQYGLLGILADDASGLFSEAVITDGLERSFTYGTEGVEGGLIRFSESETELLSYRTMLTEEGENFTSQLRKQMALESTGRLFSELIVAKELEDASHAGAIYKKQEEALAQTATVTQELLSLMELVDGIRTDENGLCTDANGRLQTNTVFIKQLTSMKEEELENQYENEEIYRAVKEQFFYPEEKASELAVLLLQAMEYEAEIAVLEAETEGYIIRQKEIAKELLTNPVKEKKEALMREAELLLVKKKQASEQRDERIEWLDLVLMDAEERYADLKEGLDRIEPLLSEAMETVNELGKKQVAAQASVVAYEEFLNGIRGEVSGELYRVFEEELQKMKLYVGLEEQGYRVSVMYHTLSKNQELLIRLQLPEFSADSLYDMWQKTELIAEEVAQYSLEGLWFYYGEITVAESAGGNVKEALGRLVNTEILSLAGLDAEDVSEKAVAGQELPSAWMATEGATTELLTCFSEMSLLFQEEGFLKLLSEAAEYSLDTVVLELYGREYFGCFGEEKEHTRLSYEREYILFGEETDSKNLLLTVLHLVAIRSIFTMTAILKDSAKMSELELLATGVAGFTGIPLLLSATKYALLLLWSVEEAVIEVAALLDGKELPFFSMQGKLSLGELFLFNGTLVKQKAAEVLGSSNAVSYEDYITLLSLARGVKKKAYRMMDLIQENLRCRYEDDFRMRNVVTAFTFRAETLLEQTIQTELWTKESYRIEATEAMAY